MKLIIDVPDQEYEDIQAYNINMDGIDVVCESILHGTPIPDNATNGDVIEKVFNTTSTQFCELVRMDNIDNGLCCSLEWWKAPYQKGGKE